MPEHQLPALQPKLPAATRGGQILIFSGAASPSPGQAMTGPVWLEIAAGRRR